MFTGIIEAVGRIARTSPKDGASTLWIKVPPHVRHGMTAGASLAVDGACLTAEVVEDDTVRVTVIASTLSRTIAEGYREGSLVNLERAARVDARLDGHLVQGHVDGIGTLVGIARAGETRMLDFRIPAEVQAASVLHGSVAINGISLTINALRDPDICQVAIIPHTWEHTNLRGLQMGSPVNVEGDLIGKYVGRMLAPHRTQQA